ncbi:enoyl-CoA hydratase [Pseudomonas sp. M47T1]|uniref:enoyl-CoA hydratase-related protein n=1 Tax=Pseudomonas sp. M47T1 TaxID=1179778 RepID=UPI00026075C8|nr:enoyl-CoA hydratase-related protein [Pseudomonas sp. M47T1]EIK95772.1 enoyl-CoA hydratase [Pseudomonas sp. M47T1]
MDNPPVIIQREGPLTLITLNRPQVHNALNALAQQALEQAFDDFDADPSQWVAIVTGAGSKAFCVGHDLKQQARAPARVTLARGFAGLTARFDLTKPVIGAVNGMAMGGGFELALACDILVASEHATFALPEPKVGLAALAGGLQRLPRAIGLKRSMGMLLTGRRLSAAEGLAAGFVNEVTGGDVMHCAREWAAQILGCSPLAIRATKEALLRGLDRPMAAAMEEQWQYPAMRQMLDSEDAHEGPQAFVEKRAPVWKGR